MAAAPKKVLVTGAAGQIGYSIVYMIARGDVFGPQQPVTLVLLDIEMMKDALEGVKMELNDCALPLLADVIATTDQAIAFKGVEAAFLVGAMPRKEGMERKDLLAANVRIFKSQGQALAAHGNPNCKVIVVGNPANTNAYILAKYAAPAINPRNISAMTRLDHNRAMAQVAAKCGVGVTAVDGVIVWGNHSSTQFPDLAHATVTKAGAAQPAYAAINDEPWIKGDFISTVQKRGGAIIQKRKLSSALSAAKAATDVIRDWFAGTGDKYVSMAVVSDGSYGIQQGIVYSFPVKIKGGEWEIVQGLSVDEYAKGKMMASLEELKQEALDAEEACA